MIDVLYADCFVISHLTVEYTLHVLTNVRPMQPPSSMQTSRRETFTSSPTETSHPRRLHGRHILRISVVRWLQRRRGITFHCTLSCFTNDFTTPNACPARADETYDHLLTKTRPRPDGAARQHAKQPTARNLRDQDARRHVYRTPLISCAECHWNPYDRAQTQEQLPWARR